jgi:hypothetical protein
MTSIKRLFLIFFSVLSLLGLAGLQLAPVAYAGNTDTAKNEACAGIGGTTTDGKCKVAGAADLDKIIRSVVGLLSIIVGVAAVIMIMVGGFKYITSGGDSSKASSAKSTITYAIIGLVIVALAQFIVRFVIHTATKPSDTDPKSKSTMVERV